MYRIQALAVAGVMLAVTAGCGSNGDVEQGLAVAGTPTCVTTEQAQDSADGGGDRRTPLPGAGLVTASYEFPPGDPQVLIKRLLPGLAVVTVEARGEAVAVTGRENLAGSALPRTTELRAAAPGTREFSVVRPVTFRVDRVFRGDLPNCLTLGVPGGSTGLFVENAGPNFPDSFEVSDRFLATFSPAGSPPGIGQLLPVSEDGTVRLPFFSTMIVDLDTWIPPPYEGIMR